MKKMKSRFFVVLDPLPTLFVLATTLLSCSTSLTVPFDHFDHYGTRMEERKPPLNLSKRLWRIELLPLLLFVQCPRSLEHPRHYSTLLYMTLRPDWRVQQVHQHETEEDGEGAKF
jgi:hypothetical protein